jgi:hypothetical protein
VASAELRVNGYQIDRVQVVSGAQVPELSSGSRMWRLEAPGRLPLTDAPFLGATTHVFYTDSPTRAELARISRGESGPVAVLIPIRKSPEWWALGSKERQAYVMEGSPHGHVAIGRRYAERIYRRLYHARYLPGSQWDFLTYFEFPASEREAFCQLLAELRSVELNPEWAFVDRETEIWMTKL